MLAINTPIRAAACRSCGAYDNSTCSPTCRPGRVIKLGVSRRAVRDSRTSAVVRANARIQDFLVRNF